MPRGILGEQLLDRYPLEDSLGRMPSLAEAVSSRVVVLVWHVVGEELQVLDREEAVNSILRCSDELFLVALIEFLLDDADRRLDAKLEAEYIVRHIERIFSFADAAIDADSGANLTMPLGSARRAMVRFEHLDTFFRRAHDIDDCVVLADADGTIAYQLG